MAAPTSPAPDTSAHPIAIVINAHSGGGVDEKTVRQVTETIAAAGRTSRIMLVRHGRDAPAAAKRAIDEGCSALVAGGGDGTVNAVAPAAVGTGIPFGILPLGTLNHFARDLGLPRDLDGALAVVLAGVTQDVDVGEVNGRIFLNNSSLGVYPRIVRLRERLREAGLGKWLGALWATLTVVRRRPFMAVGVIVDGKGIVRRTPFVLVANNEYRMEGIRAGTRESLAAGRLWIYVMNASGRRSLLWLAVQILLGRTQRVQELEAISAMEATVEVRRRHVGVALDGEVFDLRPPLRYRVRPGALTVLVPA